MTAMLLHFLIYKVESDVQILTFLIFWDKHGVFLLKESISYSVKFCVYRSCVQLEIPIRLENG